jgi:hypothetical protein
LLDARQVVDAFLCTRDVTKQGCRRALGESRVLDAFPRRTLDFRIDSNCLFTLLCEVLSRSQTRAIRAITFATVFRWTWTRRAISTFATRRR